MGLAASMGTACMWYTITWRQNPYKQSKINGVLSGIVKIDNENMEDIKQNNEKRELPYALVLMSPPKIMLKVNPQGNNTEREQYWEVMRSERTLLSLLDQVLVTEGPGYLRNTFLMGMKLPLDFSLYFFGVCLSFEQVKM